MMARAVSGWRFRGLGGLSRIRRLAGAASLVWVVLVAAYAFGFFNIAVETQTRGMVFLDGMSFLVALVLPLILIWLAAWMAGELERQREIIAALAELSVPLMKALGTTSAALEHNSPVSQDQIQKAVQGAMLSARGVDLAAPVERVLTVQAEIQNDLQALLARPAASAAPVAPEPADRGSQAEPDAEEPDAEEPPAPQKARAPDPEPVAETPPDPNAPEVAFGLGWHDLIRALDFPRDGDDHDGFRALKAALRHHRLARMLQAAEDVLNLLSQEGAYVDDLTMGPIDAGDWRKFIAGARGPEVASVGGITDANALALARGLIKSDPIFRDTALFFQRRFDVVLTEFGANASDAQIEKLAGTRSGRAFMLLARLSGSFD